MPELTPHQAKALDIKHSISLRANAGSGKTSVLSKRYIQIAVEGNVSLQKIAAITFTDKAAGELYKRISDEIVALIMNTKNPVIIKRLEKIRRQLVSANISTIHSFCVNILREFPVEAELDANFTSIDQNLSRELLELSVDEILREKLEKESNDELKYLMRLFDSKSNLTKQLFKLIDNRKIVFKLEEKIYNKTTDEIAEYFRKSFNDYFKIIYLPQVETLKSDLGKINFEIISDNPENESGKIVKDLIERLKKTYDIEVIIKITAELVGQIFTKSLTLKKRGYFRNELRDGFAEEIFSVEKIISNLSLISLNDESEQTEWQLALTGKYLLNLFDDTLHLYDQKKKESGYIDYEDILIKTKKLLLLVTVTEYLNEKFSYLMVDEYQDTNELQYDIFMPILDYLRKGNLFIVGDEKQSIYRFRDAELEVFNKTNKDISSKDGKDHLLTLPDSFRMNPAICLFTNLLFRNLFSKLNELFNEVDHADIICAKKDAKPGSVSIILAEKDSELSEAQLVTAQIIKLVSDKYSEIDWQDVGVLVRKRSWFRELEKEFTKIKVPYRIVGGRGFFQRQSIYDIYNYFSFLLDIHNDAALVGILRSPFFTLSDAEIYEISLKPGLSYWDKLITIGNHEKKYLNIRKNLRDNIEIAGKIDFNGMLRKILEESNFISVLASRQDGEQELANIDKLLKITNTFSTQGFKTLYDYVSFLKDAIHKLEDEAQAGLTSISNAVNLLTLHQAKGLEFPAVFLYKCYESSRSEIARSKSIIVDKTFGLLTKVPTEGNYFSDYKSAPVVTIRDFIEERKNLAEVKRLFYVGITRAKDYLFLSAKADKDETYNPTSFMGLLYEGLKLSTMPEEIVLEDNLKFLIHDNNKYRNEMRHLKVKIPVYRKINLIEEEIKEETNNIDKKNLLLTKVEDKAEGEIISATKVSTYSQCPLKYKFIYKYGYTELFSGFKNLQNDKPFKSDYLDYPHEDRNIDENSEQQVFRADVKGTLIHKALQEEIGIDKLKDFFDEEINKLYTNIFDTENKRISFINEISGILKNFYHSKEYALLKAYSDYKIEFEIYIREKDHFLYGIIDRLIVDKDKAIIIDYKTDDIEKSEIKERVNLYIYQLKFYIYIVSKLYKNISEFEARIIFLKYPDDSFKVECFKNDLVKIDREINSKIKGILAEDFSKNLSHCVQCNFSIKTRCII